MISESNIPAINISNICLRRQDKTILDQVSWRVQPGEHWAIIGANGSGKTSLLQIACGYIWPSDGEVDVLGNHYGEVDLRMLRRRIGWVSSALVGMIRRGQKAWQIVVTGAFASTGLFDEASSQQVQQARQLLQQVGCPAVADSSYDVLSLGEQQKVLIARALMARPQLLILDEACAGLDLPSRESLLGVIDELAHSGSATLVWVSHHIEEITPSFTHVLAMKKGKVLAAGKKQQVLTGRILSEVFDINVEVEERFGRYWTQIAGRVN